VPIALVYTLLILLSIFLVLNTSMQYKVLHTTGAFGNFIAYLIDSHVAGQLLSSPFNASGSSDSRNTPTENLHGGESFYHMKEFDKDTETKFIACVWDEEFFPYMLHASYGRSNRGQYDGCGVSYLEKNFYDFNKKGNGNFDNDIALLKKFFNLDINKDNPTVPRYILRQYFWLKFFYKNKHKFCTENSWLKGQQGIIQLDIADIIDYDRLKSFFASLFGQALDFRSLHNEFRENNHSMKDFEYARQILSAVRQESDTCIGPISVIGEAFMCFELEKLYFDIPFFSRTEFFKSTGEILDYVKYFPNSMKQPNKLFVKDYKRFQPKEK